MKKNILLFGALIGAFLLVSCSGGNKNRLRPPSLRRNWIMPVK